MKKGDILKELEHLIEKYLYHDNNAIVHGKVNQECINKTIYRDNIMQYERPDILSVFDNKIVGIEHFEFDCFKNNKDGSKFKEQKFKIEKRFDEIVQKDLQTKDSVVVHDKIEEKSSTEYYFENFKKIFSNHYDRIEEYIEHIKSEYDCADKEIHMCFWAEDVSPLGSTLVNAESGLEVLLPIYSDEIVELLNNSPKIEYLIISTYAMKEYKIIIIENKKEVFEKFKQDYGGLEEKQFLDFKPITTGFASKISKEIIEKELNKKGD